jgi:chemotaxis protein methyltransferase CheR
MHSELECPGPKSLSAREFEEFRALAYETFGLALKTGKEQLVSARLGKIISRLQLRSFQDYYEHVVGDKSGQALLEMVDALATNHTSFLREKAHFDFLLNQVVPELQACDLIRIWCAACSTGEEPYSLAFCLLDALQGNGRRGVHILATDISNKALSIARRGIYAANRLEGLPPAWLPKYLLRGEKRSQGLYLVKPEVRKLIEFRRFNLIEPLPSMDPFPVIFCRNVMIYFDKHTREGVVNRLANCLTPGGYLFIGHAESLSGLDQPLEYIRPAVYKKSSSRQITFLKERHRR